eukprot:GFUD01018616.1.p2 GENE.GFUD01018616.1~~GFUD01018616.1.p2  ORF type:complete len:103 (+),score=20.35 GFUD01018616.1:1261-1569(+)
MEDCVFTDKPSKPPSSPSLVIRVSPVGWIVPGTARGGDRCSARPFLLYSFMECDLDWGDQRARWLFWQPSPLRRGQPRTPATAPLGTLALPWPWSSSLGGNS